MLLGLLNRQSILRILLNNLLVESDRPVNITACPCRDRLDLPTFMLSHGVQEILVSIDYEHTKSSD
jgi:hypothetical protein